MKQLINYYNRRPFFSIIIIALIFRLIAAFFSQGFGMHDDHYLVIEASQSWVDGTDFDDWLPESQRQLHPDIEPQPEGHSFFYVGMHYVFFLFLKSIGIFDPKIKMLLVRIIHALFSLLIVIYGYKITLKVSNQKTALQVALILALLWAMPFLSVRNLVEFVCIPFLMIGIYLTMQVNAKINSLIHYFIAGLVIGISFSLRFQTSIFIGGLGLAILISGKWKGTFTYGIGVLLSVFIIQGIVDIIIWGRPFAEMMGYIIYNYTHKYDYLTNSFFMYIFLLIGMLIPPLGLFLFFGMLRTWKKVYILFIPTILFLVFHMLFPNKQERFILPILPFFIILGFIGWNEYVENSRFWQKNLKLLKCCLIFFWSINLFILPFLTTAYSKKSRIESLVYLSKDKQVNGILIEDTNKSSATTLPLFYLNQWVPVFRLGKSDVDSSQYSKLEHDSRYTKIIYNIKYFKYHPEQNPEYILFVGDKQIHERTEKAKKVFPEMIFETRIQPGFLDEILFKLNPNNYNQAIYIYKVNN